MTATIPSALHDDLYERLAALTDEQAAWHSSTWSHVATKTASDGIGRLCAVLIRLVEHRGDTNPLHAFGLERVVGQLTDDELWEATVLHDRYAATEPVPETVRQILWVESRGRPRKVGDDWNHAS